MLDHNGMLSFSRESAPPITLESLQQAWNDALEREPLSDLNILLGRKMLEFWKLNWGYKKQPLSRLRPRDTIRGGG